MTALAVNEVVCNNTSEFLNKNNESTETTADNMKLAMAVDDDAMAETIETTELSNGYTDLIDVKNCKENFIPDTAQSDTTSQYDTPRSEHSSTPMEDTEDNCSITLRLSDDEEDAEITTEKEIEKCESNISEKNNENVEMETTEKDTAKSENQPDNVEVTNEIKNTDPENVEKMETDAIISTSSDETDGDKKLTKENVNLNGTATENHDTASVNDILSDIDNCLGEENNSNPNDIDMNQEGLNESIASNEQDNVSNDKEESHSDFQISCVTTQEDFKISNVATEGDIKISNVETGENVLISNDASEGDIQISNVVTEGNVQISNAAEGDLKNSNIATESDIEISNITTEGDNQISNIETEEDIEINNVGGDIQISNVATEEDYDKEFKLSMEENLDDNTEEDVDKPELTKTDEENISKNNEEDISNDETEKSEENSNYRVINLDEVVDSDKDSDTTDKTENNDENQEINTENPEATTLTKDAKCDETTPRRTSETFKRKIDEPLDECNESKKIKTDSLTSNTKDSCELDQAAASETKLNEKDESINSEEKKDESKVNEKNEKPTTEIKKKLILRVLPLLFENEQIPNVNLEELILTKIIESISMRTEIATLRQKSQSQEQIIDQLRRKATHLSKQLEDINTVTNRLTVDLLNKDRPVAPVKITRSVGLQVSIPTAIGKRYSTINPSNSNRKRIGPNSSSNHHSPATNNNNSSATNYNSSSTNNNNSSATNTSQSNANSNISPAKTPSPAINTPARSPSLLNKALTKTTNVSRNSAMVVHSTPPKQQPESPAKQNKEKAPTENRAVTVDLTDDDSDLNKIDSKPIVAQNPPSLIPITGNLRMVTSLGNTMSTTSSTNQPQRVTYLMATPAGPGQNRLLIATSPGTTGSPRPALTVVGQPNVRGTQGTRYLVNTTNGQQAIVQRPGIVLTNGQTPNTVRTVPVRVNNGTNRTNALPNSRSVNSTLHPAPLPILLNQPHLPSWRQIPPRPSLKISRTKDGGIQLSWSMPELDQKIHEEVASYQLYAYQEGSAPPSTDLWRKVGDVKALPLPMACTLTSFHPGNKYYFAVRAIDVHSRVSQFSYAQPISLHN